MHHAANLPFERIVDEFARWRAVPEPDRSQAPGWWWGPAFELLGVDQPMPPQCCVVLELPDGASFTDGATVFLKSLAGQTSLPWPDGFPGRPRHPDPA